MWISAIYFGLPSLLCRDLDPMCLSFRLSSSFLCSFSSCSWVLSDSFVTDDLQIAWRFAKQLQLHPVQGCIPVPTNKASTWLFSPMIEEVSPRGFHPLILFVLMDSRVKRLQFAFLKGKTKNVVVVYFRLTLLIHSYLNSRRDICGSTFTNPKFSC